MKKVFSVLLCVFSAFVFASSSLFAGSAFAVSSSPVTWEDLGDDAISLRDSYFELWSSYGNGNFNQLFKSASDIPVNWFKTLADGVLALSPVDDIFFTYEEVKPVVFSGTPKGKAFLEKYKITPETPVISSDDFAVGIEKENSEFSPKGELSKISYRTDETFQKYINFPTTARTDYFKPYLVDNNNFVHVGSTTSNSLYFVLFYKDTKEYISEYQFRLYFDSRAVEADDGSKDFVTYPRLQIWSNVDGTPSEPIDFLDGTVDCSEYKYYYLDFSFSSTYFRLYGFKTFSDYLNNRAGTVFQKSYFTNYYSELFLSDFSSSVKFENMINKDTSHSFKGSYSYHDKTCSCPLGGKDDIGLYVSAHPIEFTYADIDISKIPTGQIVTINGDTIYNYTITNPETGDSSKFGDYITNNYTYITNNYGGDSGGSGVGGNVTVGGSIDVGGSVGVDITVSVPDININVNGNGGAGGNSSLPDTDLVENLPEAPSGFIDYTASLFSFLPAEILSLLIAGLAAAIFCRIWGR